MGIIGIGTDIVQTKRIKRLMDKFPTGFIERILHENELEVYKEFKNPVSYVARRFAAKEAVSKALGTGIAGGVSFHDIEISNTKDGQPVLTLYGETLAIANKLGVKKHHITLSDEKKYAVAYVILES
ncbi:holo-ACP synthase [Cocleimonas flava]|jgi:holo-[acyl-carrier protein] synthase|uniref:Holo-[acyl-carrier-protein] synthase n=1 Tax=Cocleimonas flava TaxID=634765 RepID=A0A4R1ET17_9GAMM|nr:MULTISPECIES: holo-ACP synthase [Cocleimonas]MEB8433915.1 holo-ACP synthase [Cocleimonas sp. KMM 6892]MEC4716726.1 holo-ACP synthase [Cocleimonas sp. KMM 6895]MEC4746119.1 holo-ACP synthase [Cocleimonas sp. KMM 6896]TCJ84757.1 holo-[acyl-carrier protein] synthase [Cocleimonas flava]